jgi:hypothetical protein
MAIIAWRRRAWISSPEVQAYVHGFHGYKRMQILEGMSGRQEMKVAK